MSDRRQNRRNQHVFNQRAPRAARLVMSASGLMLGGLGVTMGGCEVDSYLDPSVVGYWEHTATSVPILERLAAIEELPQDQIETSEPAREDLIAEAMAYRLGPSDEVEVQIENFSQSARTDVIPAIVDQRGYINFPKVGSLYVLGKTDAEVTEIIARVIREKEILANPKVLVTVSAQRQQTFSVTGGVANPGGYFIPKPDYRLLEALTAAGGVSESAQKILVIRQVPLSDEVRGISAPPASPEVPTVVPETAPPVKPEDVKDIMNEILEKGEKGAGAPGSPGVMGRKAGGTLGAVGGAGAGKPGGTPGPLNANAGTARQPEKKPEIDLVDERLPGNSPAASPQPETVATPARAKTKWVFINGQWTKQTLGSPRATPTAPSIDPLAKENIAADVMTQRVIEVPAQRLLAGHADVNIVIRPGDVIRVPVPDTGLYYIEGAINNPGAYGIPPTGKITLQQAIAAANGLAGQAIPSRVDITRRIANDREATIRLDYGAIANKSQPNVYIKPDDVINIGTNFWAFPLAVFRQGIRASYGFGFLLDRNFGGEVFGVDRSLNR